MKAVPIVLLSVVCGAIGAGCGVGRVYFGARGESAGGIDFTDQNGNGVDDALEGTALPSGDVSGGNASTETTHTVSPDAPGCGRGQIAPAAKSPVHFMFTLDRSSSMNDTTPAMMQSRPTKWEALQAAMQAVFDSLGDAAAGGATPVAVGVNYFSSATDTSVEQPMALLDRARATALMNDLSMRTANGSTATENALAQSYTALAQYTPGPPLANGVKVEVLVSDGKPNPAPAMPSDITDRIDGARTGPSKVHTFSIGIGELNDTSTTGYDPKFMAQVALHGGTAKPGCDPDNTSDASKFCHYQITPSVSGANLTADLVAAFDDIRQSVRSCTLPLAIEDPAKLEPRAVIVVAEKPGQPQRILTPGATNGWTFDVPAAPTSITLHGTECDALKNDQSVSVFAVLGCACPGGLNYGGSPAPARDSESGTDWETNWCSYPWVPLAPCVGESCL